MDFSVEDATVCDVKLFAEDDKRIMISKKDKKREESLKF